MALRVADLFADLSLRTAKFSGGMKEAVGTARKAGAEMEDAFGKRPRKALQESEKHAARVTWAVRGYIKDTSRIITGILISQTFYSLIRTIRESIAAVWEFRGALEQSAIQFNYLLGDARASSAMLRELRIFAADTPFNLQESIQAARTLLATGFKINTVLPVMRGLTDVAAATGAEYAKIADIFGQIKSEGRLTAMTMRRLQKMAIPVTQILREELGLTANQIVRIGKEAIPADIAIQALLRGWQKRFKGAAQDVQKTLLGMMNAIKDYSLFVASKVIDSAFLGWKGNMERLLENLKNIHDGIERMGVAYLLEGLIPKELHTSIRIIIGALKSLWDSLKIVWQAIRPLAGALGEWLVRALAIVTPMIAGLVRILAYMFTWATHNSHIVRILVGIIVGLAVAGVVAAQVALLAQAIKLLGIAKAVGTAVQFLATSIQVLYVAMSKHPVVAVITILAAVFIGLAMSIKSVSDWLDRVMKQLMSLFGLNFEDILKPTDPEDLTDALASVSDSFEDIVDDAADAGKAIKKNFLASFDEVFQVPDTLDDISGMFEKLADFKWPTTDRDDEDSGFEGGGGSGGGGAFGDGDGIFPLLPPPPDWTRWIAPTAVVTSLAAIVAHLTRMRKGTDSAGEAAKRLMTVTLPIAVALGATALGRWVSDSLKSLQEWTGKATQPFRDWASDSLGVVRQWGTDLGTAVSTGLALALLAILGFPGKVTKAFTDWVKDSIEQARRWGKGVRTQVELTLALMVVAIASFPARAWGHLKIGFDFLIEKFKEWGRNLGETMSENKGLILGIVGLLVLGIVLSFAGLPASVGAAIAGLVTTVVGVFSNVGVAVAAEVDETKRATLTKWQEIKQGIVDKWEELKKNAGQKWSEIRTSVETHVQGTTSWVGERWQGTRTTLASIWDGLNVTARNKWNAVKTTIKDVINSIIELINKFIRFWNSMRLNVPEVDIPLLGKRGGFSVGLPKVPEIPRLRRGGIIPEDMIVRAGERSPEAIVPLTGEDARPFARVIANELAAVISGGGSESSLPPMYVGTLVADERGLRELYRKFKVIDLSEKTRRG